MNIKQLRYFITIVENNFNLSRAAKSLYTVQPTLSVMINNFERNENVQLFIRKKGLITGLTAEGEVFYKDALAVIEKYNLMKENLHNLNTNIKGEITIGIPPLFFSLFFSSVIPDLITNNPDITFKIVEEGAVPLSNKLLLGEIDIAALLYPEGISHNIIESYEIQNSELVLFMSSKHRFASKDKISWNDLHQQKVVSLSKSYMTYKLFKQQCELQNVFPNVVFYSDSWELLIALARRDHSLIAVLQKPVEKIIHFPDIVLRHMEEPVPWRATLCRLTKGHYSKLEDYILTQLLKAKENL